MSKVVTSPVPEFPGTVTLAQPMNYPQMIAFRDAVEAVKAHADDVLRAQQASLPGVCACVERWDLAPLVTNGAEPVQYLPDTFPSSPLRPAIALLAWLTGEVNRIAIGEAQLPNV